MLVVYFQKGRRGCFFFTFAQVLRAAMDRGGLQHRRLLPVVVSALARKDVPPAEIEKAEQMKIALVFRDDLESALQRSMFGENAADLYAQALAGTTGSGQLSLTN